jgi:uncharacterized protein YndB with AHSA1/START domain
MNLSIAAQHSRSPTLRAASVRVSRQLRGSPERIFDAWLDAGELRAFLLAGGVAPCIRPQIDARIGGEFRIVGYGHRGQVEYSGEYLEIDRPQRLVFSLFVEKYAQWDDRVIVELAPVAGQSLLLLTHELSLPNPVQRSRVQRGWARVLDGLAAVSAEESRRRAGGTHSRLRQCLYDPY